MEIDIPITKKYLNPSMLSQMIQSNNIPPPKRKFGGVILQENIPEGFQAEFVKRSVAAPAAAAPFKFKIPLIKPGKQEKSPSISSSSRSSSSSSRSSSAPKVKRQKGGLRLPGASPARVASIKSEPKAKTKKTPTRRTPAKKTAAKKTAAKKTAAKKTAAKKKIALPPPIVIDPSQKMGSLYVMGEDVELQPNDFRSKPLTFRVMNKLGKGSYGEVFQVFPISKDLPNYFPKTEDEFTSYAMKVMIDTEGKRSFEYEHQIMDLIASNFKDQPGRCPNHVVCYFDISIDKNGKYHMLSEKMDGNIQDYVDNMKSSTINSRLTLALKVFEQTLNGLEDLKKVGLLHRDLKEENLLYKIPAPNGRAKPSEIVIKIGDFGLSCVPGLKELDCGRGIAGTLRYLDPKILILVAAGASKTIDQLWTDKSDMYSLAVILYQIIFGDLYLQDEDWYIKINPTRRRIDQLDAKLLTKGYNEIYQRNIVNVDELIKQYENSKTEKNRKIVKMLRFIKRNLVPFDFDQRTNLEDSVSFYT